MIVEKMSAVPVGDWGRSAFEMELIIECGLTVFGGPLGLSSLRIAAGLTSDAASPILWGFATSSGCPAAVAQLVECVLGKDEVMGSNPISSSCGLSSFVSSGSGCSRLLFAKSYIRSVVF